MRAPALHTHGGVIWQALACWHAHAGMCMQTRLGSPAHARLACSSDGHQPPPEGDCRLQNCYQLSLFVYCTGRCCASH